MGRGILAQLDADISRSPDVGDHPTADAAAHGLHHDFRAFFSQPFNGGFHVRYAKPEMVQTLNQFRRYGIGRLFRPDAARENHQAANPNRRVGRALEILVVADDFRVEYVLKIIGKRLHVRTHVVNMNQNRIP